MGFGRGKRARWFFVPAGTALKKIGNDFFLIILFVISGIMVICLSLFIVIGILNLSGINSDLSRRLVFIFSANACLAAAGVIIGVYKYFRNRLLTASFNLQINQQELMARLSRNFISITEAPDFINEALQLTGEFLNTERVAVCIVSELPVKTGRAAYFWSKSNEYVPFPNTSGLFELISGIFPEEQPFEIPTYCCNNTSREPLYETMRLVGIKSFLWAPLYLEKKFWALFSIEDFKYRKWTEGDRQLIGMVSSIIAASVERNIQEKDRNAARQQAEFANKTKSDFLANMSHEMRTPMNAIIGMATIAKKTPYPEKKEYCLNRIENASIHLMGIINDILDMSKIEANKFKLTNEEFNFERMLQKVISALNFRIEEKKQFFTIHIDHRIPEYLYGDEIRLSQVITNLLSNAIKFTPEGGSVHFDAVLEDEQALVYKGPLRKDEIGTLELSDDWCVLRMRVTDNGIGLTAEQKTRIWNSFEQAESGSSRKFGGTGLGLAISRNIVEMMGGEIFVISSPGNGSSFIFTVHLKKSYRKKNTINETIDWKNIRILAVDDDQNISDYFTDIAGRLGFICDTASNGEDAMYKMCNTGPYNFFFINWILSDMDGVALSRAIKKTDPNASVALMISSTDWNALDDNTKNSGPDIFLKKPLFPSAIVDSITKCLGKEDRIPVLAVEETGTELFKGRTIMLVEDVDINREIVLALLEPLGLTVICAVDGLEAVQLFRHSPDNFDLILMDIQMPVMDGYEATGQIRAFESETRKQHVPIIALTANVFKEDVEKCLAVGMNDHVGKPLDSNLIIDKLRQYL